MHEIHFPANFICLYHTFCSHIYIQFKKNFSSCVTLFYLLFELLISSGVVVIVNFTHFFPGDKILDIYLFLISDSVANMIFFLWCVFESWEFEIECSAEGKSICRLVRMPLLTRLIITLRASKNQYSFLEKFRSDNGSNFDCEDGSNESL